MLLWVLSGEALTCSKWLESKAGVRPYTVEDTVSLRLWDEGLFKYVLIEDLLV